MKTKVLLIGSGNRIVNNFLPAFKCLDDLFEITGIHSRSEKNFQPVAREWNLKGIPVIDSSVLTDVDLIVVSITTSHVLEVLRTLSAYGYKKKILVDTPVCSFKHYSELKVLRNFSHVFVAEDFAHFTRYELIKDFISRNQADVLYVGISKLGYGYHASALLRTFFDNRIPAQVLTTVKNKQINHQLLFGNNHFAEFTHPYDPNNGNVKIKTSKFNISMELMNNVFENHIESDFILERHENKFVLLNQKKEKVAERELEFYHKILSFPIKDRSDFNVEKTHGLIQIIRTSHDKNPDVKYTFDQGIFDSLVEAMGKVPGWYKILGNKPITKNFLSWIFYILTRRKHQLLNKLFKS